MKDLFENLPWYKKIQVLRVINGWSQVEAAERCFTVQKAYWTWECGQVYPRKNSRRAISQAFRIPESDIFD